MEEKHLEMIIREIWPRLKKKHLYPEIPVPKVKRTSHPKQGEVEEDEEVEKKGGKPSVMIGLHVRAASSGKELPGPVGLAKGSRVGFGDLQAHRSFSEIRDLRLDRAGAPGRG